MKRTGLMLAAFGLFLFAQIAQAGWTPAKRLTWNLGSCVSPAIAIDSNNQIHIVWMDLSSGNFEIYYKRSADGGVSWSATKRLTWSSGLGAASLYPTIAIDSSNTIHVLWGHQTTDYPQIFYRRSTDGGMTWSAAKRLTWSSGGCSYPAVAIDSSSTIHIVWNDYTPGNQEVYYKKSTNGGATWGAAQRLTWTSGDSPCPAIATDSSNGIHLVWFDYTPGSCEIYYRKSSDGGSTWGTIKRLTWTSGWSRDQAIAIDSNNTIHIVWCQYPSVGWYEIYHMSSKNGGSTWSAAQRLTWTSGQSIYPTIDIDSSKTIHIVWQDDTPDQDYPEIYYKRSTDGGTTWSAIQRLTWTSGRSMEPEIATDSINFIHLLWMDSTPGFPEIYYKKGN
jgi:hypothetical protein